MGGAADCYGMWKFAKNKEGAIEFLKYYADHWAEAFKASDGYNKPFFANIVPKPMPILSNDPSSHPSDKLAVLQDSDEWCAVSGYPGPAWPAVDEVYNDFVICDMMTKAATGTMSAEDAVKWATQECEAIFKKWHATPEAQGVGPRDSAWPGLLRRRSGQQAAAPYRHGRRVP